MIGPSFYKIEQCLKNQRQTDLDDREFPAGVQGMKIPKSPVDEVS
jgi:hypothetical protein